MTILESKLAILDETGSGLYVDAIRILSKGVRAYSSDQNAILVYNHYNKILDYLEPYFVHILLVDGKIVKTGEIELVEKIEEKGYEEFKTDFS